MEAPQATPKATLHIEVCYASAQVQTLLSVTLFAGATVCEAIELSGILRLHPEIDLSVQKTGVFGQFKPLEARVAAGDRIEIYRPLLADPKAARRQRVAQARAAGSAEGRKWR